MDNELLQEKLIEKGYAKLKYIYAKYENLDKLIELENISKIKRLGLWREENYINEYNILDNPRKIGCRFIGWEYNNKLYDMTNNKRNIDELNPKFSC